MKRRGVGMEQAPPTTPEQRIQALQQRFDRLIEQARAIRQSNEEMAAALDSTIAALEKLLAKDASANLG